MSAAPKLYLCFENVGREKRSFRIDCSECPADDFDGSGLPSLDWMAAQAKKSGGLMSRDVVVLPISDDDDCDVFEIYAGVRCVGSVRMERAEVRP